MSNTIPASFNTNGQFPNAVGTIGYTIYTVGGSVSVARTTSGIAEIPAGSGNYGTNATIPGAGGGFIGWDTGVGTNPTLSPLLPVVTGNELFEVTL